MQLVKYKSQKAALIKNSHDDINVHIWQRKKKCIVQRKKISFKPIIGTKYLETLGPLTLEKGMIKLQRPMEILLSNSWNKPELE